MHGIQDNTTPADDADAGAGADDGEQLEQEGVYPATCTNIDQNNTVLGRRRRTRPVIKVLRSNPEEGKHNELCRRVFVPWRDEGATKCFFADVCLGEGGWQYKDILNDVDGLMREDLSEDWQGESPAL